MSHIDIHPRIEQRHPEIKPQDVYDAVRGMVSYTRRLLMGPPNVLKNLPINMIMKRLFRIRYRFKK